MAFSEAVAKIEGAMIGYRWKSRLSPDPEGYTNEYFSDTRIFSRGQEIAPMLPAGKPTEKLKKYKR